MEFIEITNIIDINFDTILHSKSFIDNYTIYDYFPEYDEIVMLVNREEVDAKTYIVKKDDSIFFTVAPAGKGAAKWIALAIVVIIIAVMTYGAGLGAAGGAGGAGGGAAGGAGGAAAGGAAGGASLGGINVSGLYAAEMGGAASGAASGGAAASTGMGASFLGKVALLAGSMVVNSLLAPKMPDGDDKAPERSAYLWGDNRTQSQLMIPIPIVAGKFPCFGNLVASRTETKNNTSVYEPLYDIGYYEYGLTSNQLDSIEEIYFSKLPASQMESDDTVIFYTKGTEEQSFLYGIPGSNQENETYRFPTLISDNDNPYNNAPLEDGEALNPGLRVETTYNVQMLHPEHEIVGWIFDEYEQLHTIDTSFILGEFDGMYPGLTPIPEGFNGTFDAAIYPKSRDDDIRSYYTDASDLPYNVGDDLYIVIKFQDEDNYEIYQKTLIGTITEVISKPIPAPYYEEAAIQDNFYYGWKVHVRDMTGTGMRIELGTNTYITFLSEQNAAIYSQELDPYNVKPDDDNWRIARTTLNTLDKFEIELFLPRGLFYEYQDSETDVDLYHAWVTFEYIIQYSPPGSGAITESLFLSPQGKRLWLDQPDDVFYKDNQPIMGLDICVKQPRVYSISSHDIINHPWAVKHPDYGSRIIELEDGKLKNGTYAIYVRIQNSGTNRYRRPDGTFYSYAILLSPEKQRPYTDAHNNNETLANQVILYRVKEYDYTENCTYPFTSILGFTFTASQENNGSLPQISAVCKNKILVWDETPDTEEDLINHYSYQFSSNPAYICLNLLFDSYYGAALGGYGSHAYGQQSQEFADCLDKFKRLVDIKAFCDFALYCDEPCDINGLPTFSANPNNPEYSYDSDSGTWKPKRYACNGLIDKTYTVIDWINKIVGTYDAKIFFKGSQLSLIYEKEIDVFVPDQVFTSSNILRDSFNQAFLNPSLMASILETTFMDEDNQYEKTPITFMPYDGLAINDPSSKSSVNLFGITNLHRALERLHSILRKTNYLTQIVDFSTSTQGFTRRIGDKIGVIHEYIEWGLIKTEVDNIQAGGRVTKIDHTAFDIYLDRLIHIDDEPVDLIGQYIYIRSMKDDNLYFRTVINDYRTVFGKTVLTIPTITDPEDLDIWNTLGKYDIFLLGQYDKVYKECLITDISFQSDNVIKIKAVVYDDAIFAKGDLITDIVGNLFGPAECKVQNCTVNYDEQENINTISWEAPNLIAKPSETNTSKFKIELEKYLIYRKIQNPITIFDPNDESKIVDLSDWEQIGESFVTSYKDEVTEKSISYAYKVTTILKINTYLARVPLSWNDMCRKYVTQRPDYLDPVIPLDYGFERVKDDVHQDAYDFTIVCQDVKDYKLDWNNMVLVWLKISDSSSDDWLGNQTIATVEDAGIGDKYIYVNSIVGLPRSDKDTSKVFGLVVLDNREIVFVINSTQLSSDKWELELYYHDEVDSEGRRLRNKFFNRRYYLSSPISRSSKVVNAHLGFYPIRMFACSEENGIITSPSSNIVTFTSLYYYDYKYQLSSGVGVVRKLDATSTVLQNELVAMTTERKYYPITVGTDNLITGVGAEGAGLTDKNNIFISLFQKSSTQMYDIDINYAWKTLDEETHTIPVAAIYPCPEMTWLDVVGRKEQGQFNFTFRNIKIPPGHNVWTALTHIYTINENTDDPYGYTSFPVNIGR